MRTSTIANIAATAAIFLAFSAATTPSQAQTKKAAYPTMAPLSAYLIPSEQAEIALARSAAPSSIADHADVMVLRRDGFATVVHGTNGFVCIVERSWAKPTDAPDFWYPDMRAPNCFNAAAARTVLPIFLMKTRLALAGKSPAQILAATNAAFAGKRLPALAPEAMCYMMSKQQFLSNSDKSWRPHVMFYGAGNVAKTWGANLPGSPLTAVNDLQEHVTVFMMLAPQWSDGSPAPSMTP